MHPSEIAQFGQTMITALRLVSERGPYPSRTHLARDISAVTGKSHSGAESSIGHCLKRDVLGQVHDHPMRGRGSAGAIVLTDSGSSALSLYSFKPDDTLEPATTSRTHSSDVDSSV